MTDEQKDWPSALATLFDATVNQQTLEEAVDLMLFVSREDSSYHEECLNALDLGIASLRAGEETAIACINMSGYRVTNLESAIKLLSEFRGLYLLAYESYPAKH